MTLLTSVGYFVSVSAAGVLIARMLGVDARGAVAEAVLIPMIVAYAGELGIPVATGYLMNAEPGRRSDTVAAARLLCITLSAVLTVLSLLLSLLVPLDREVRDLSLVFSAFVVLNVMQRLELGVLQADFRMRAFNVVRLAGALGYLGLVLLFYGTGTGTAMWVVIAQLAGNVIWAGLSTALAIRRPTVSVDRERITSLLRYGIRAHLGNVSSVETLRIDQLVLAIFLSQRELGLYVAAMTFVTADRVIGVSVGIICFPLAGKNRHEKREVITRQLTIALLGTLVLSALAAAIQALGATQLLRVLFGSEFEPGATSLQVLAVASVFMNLRQVEADWVRGRGRPFAATLAEAVSLISLGLAAFVLWDGSVVGVAGAVCISSLFAFVTLSVIVRAELKRPSTRLVS